MNHEKLVRRALQLMQTDQEYLDDARAGHHVGNTVIGAVLAITYRSPRQYTEAAVAEALAILTEQEATHTQGETTNDQE